MGVIYRNGVIYGGGGDSDVKIFTTTATLSKDINATTTVTSAQLPDVDFEDIVIGSAIVKDAEGTVGVVTAKNGTTDVTVTTSTTSSPEAELTQEEYDALTEEEQNNGTTYYVTDAPTEADFTKEMGNLFGRFSVKNVVPLTYAFEATTKHGMTLSPNGEGGLEVTGTLHDDVDPPFIEYPIATTLDNLTMVEGEYILTSGGVGMGTYNDKGEPYVQLGIGITPKNFLPTDGNSRWYWTGGTPVKVHVDAGDQLYQLVVRARYNGATVNGATIYPMLRPALVNDDTWRPHAMSNLELTEAVHKHLTYTDDEVAVGEWNGKKLYQKAFFNVDMPRLNTVTVAHKIANLGNLETITGIANPSDRTKPSCRIPCASEEGFITAEVDGTNIILNATYDKGAGYSVFLVLRYTKSS